MPEEICIILPIRFNDGKRISEEVFEETELEMVKIFGGFSVSPLRGGWEDEETGQIYKDINREYKINTKKPESEIIRLCSQFKGKLKKKFRQKEIHITIKPVTIV